MDLASLFDPTSTTRKLALGLGAALLLILACLACAWGGYRHGRSTAQAEGDAKYSKLEAAHALALAEASAKALDRYARETERADALATDLHAARERLASTRTLTLKEIPHATAGLDACAFGTDFLRVYTQALGYGPGGVSAAPGSGGAAAEPAAAAAPDAGIR